MWQSVSLERDWLSRIETKQVIEPSLHLIVKCISDGIGHSELLESLKSSKLFTLLGVAFLSDFLDELEGKRSSCPFIPVDSAAHEHIVRTEEGLDIR